MPPSSGRTELLRILAELSDLEPGTRLGQLVVNLSYLARDCSNEAIWGVEDGELLAAAREHLENRRRNLASSDTPPARTT